jgi:hypothetical protein
MRSASGRRKSKRPDAKFEWPSFRFDPSDGYQPLRCTRPLLAQSGHPSLRRKNLGIFAMSASGTYRTFPPAGQCPVGAENLRQTVDQSLRWRVRP